MKEPQTYKPAVVIPAYRRRDSLARLLKSLNEAFFPSDDNHLIISIEGGANPDVVKVAKDFRFNSGSVEIIEREDQLGIYRHIRECANFSDDYGSVIVLEDDLIVGPGFYEFACKSLSFYDS